MAAFSLCENPRLTPAKEDNNAVRKIDPKGNFLFTWFDYSYPAKKRFNYIASIALCLSKDDSPYIFNWDQIQEKLKADGK